MSTPLRELPGYGVLQAMRRLEWRYETLEDDYQDVMDHSDPSVGEHEWTFQFSRRGELYDAEKLLHHYLSGYYTYWRQVMTVGHATSDQECRGRIEALRDRHDEEPSARITRGLRMYVQKENVLPLLLFQSHHDDTTPKYAINKDDIYRDGLYDPNFDHYFGSVDGVCIYPYDVIEENWGLVTDLHEGVKELIINYMEEELTEYRDRLRVMDNVSDDLPSHVVDDFLPETDPLADELLEESD